MKIDNSVGEFNSVEGFRANANNKNKYLYFKKDDYKAGIYTLCAVEKGVGSWFSKHIFSRDRYDLESITYVASIDKPCQSKTANPSELDKKVLSTATQILSAAKKEESTAPVKEGNSLMAIQAKEMADERIKFARSKVSYAYSDRDTVALQSTAPKIMLEDSRYDANRMFQTIPNPLTEETPPSKFGLKFFAEGSATREKGSITVEIKNDQLNVHKSGAPHKTKVIMVCANRKFIECTGNHTLQLGDRVLLVSGPMARKTATELQEICKDSDINSMPQLLLAKAKESKIKSESAIAIWMPDQRPIQQTADEKRASPVVERDISTPKYSIPSPQTGTPPLPIADMPPLSLPETAKAEAEDVSTQIIPMMNGFGARVEQEDIPGTAEQNSRLTPIKASYKNSISEDITPIAPGSSVNNKPRSESDLLPQPAVVLKEVGKKTAQPNSDTKLLRTMARAF